MPLELRELFADYGTKIDKGFEEYEKLLDIHVQLGGEKKRLSGCNKRAKIEKIEKIWVKHGQGRWN